MASAVVLAALAIGATIYQPWTFLLLVMVGSVLVAWEWGRLTRGNGFDGTALIAAVSVATRGHPRHLSAAPILPSSCLPRRRWPSG